MYICINIVEFENSSHHNDNDYNNNSRNYTPIIKNKNSINSEYKSQSANILLSQEGIFIYNDPIKS